MCSFFGVNGEWRGGKWKRYVGHRPLRQNLNITHYLSLLQRCVFLFTSRIRGISVLKCRLTTFQIIFIVRCRKVSEKNITSVFQLCFWRFLGRFLAVECKRCSGSEECMFAVGRAWRKSISVLVHLLRCTTNKSDFVNVFENFNKYLCDIFVLCADKKIFVWSFFCGFSYFVLSVNGYNS